MGLPRGPMSHVRRGSTRQHDHRLVHLYLSANTCVSAQNPVPSSRSMGGRVAMQSPREPLAGLPNPVPCALQNHIEDIELGTQRGAAAQHSTSTAATRLSGCRALAHREGRLIPHLCRRRSSHPFEPINEHKSTTGKIRCVPHSPLTRAHGAIPAVNFP